MSKDMEDSKGNIIPSTQRPDGTWRKARRVKEGYVPQEEIPLYESKGKQFAQRKSTLPPGFCPQAAEAAKKEREKQERTKARKDATAAAKKQQQQHHHQQQQQPQQKHTPGVLVLPNTITKQSAGKVPNVTNVDKLAQSLENVQLQGDDALDASKKLKKLRKKLREIETIEEKIKSGELKKPEKDQLDKVKRKKEVLKEIKQLEIDEQAQTFNGSCA